MSNRKPILQVWLQRFGQTSAIDEIILEHFSVLKVFFSRNNPNELIVETTIPGTS